MIAADVTQAKKDTMASKTDEISIKPMVSSAIYELTEKSSAVNTSTRIAAK